MAVEHWIDAVTKVWEIADGSGGTVRSYRIFEKNEFPESLSEFPCALSYPLGVNMLYSSGGPCTSVWDGVTEFHFAPNVDKSNLGEVLRMINRIRSAAAAQAQLGGLSWTNADGSTGSIGHFILKPENSIQGPVTLQYGDEAEHEGLIVRWEVKEVDPVTVSI